MLDSVSLSPLDALLALGLLVFPLLLSLRWGIGIEGALLVGFGRATLQLIVLAYLLAFAFSLQSAWATWGVLGLLWLVSTQLLSRRIERDGIGAWTGLGLGLSLGLSVGYGVLVVLRPMPWFAPQIWIPLGSAVLAQGVHSGAIAACHFNTALQRHRSEIDMRLSLGASATQATQGDRRAALRAGILPTVGTGAIAGLGSLPLFFSGLVVGGIDPLEAVILELLLLLLLLFSSVITSLVVVLGLQRLSFNGADQLEDG